MVGAMVVAAGNSSRMNGINKITAKIKDVPVIVRTLINFEVCKAIDFVVVVTREDMVKEIESYLEAYDLKKVKNVVIGGDSRQESIERGISVFPADTDIIAIHDGARPFILPKIIEETVVAAKEYGGVITAVLVKDTIKNACDGFVNKTIDRSNLYSVQTPQTFNFKLYKKALSIAKENKLNFTDDSQLFENIGEKVKIVIGDYKNIKITTIEDIDIANSFLGDEYMYRIGHGYDVHRLVKDRKMILGGVTIPYSLGLLGHSDADVLVHAIIDAILGAIGKGDIGKLFPDSDSRFKDISSLLLLKYVMDEVKKDGSLIVNIDATVILQEPKIGKYIDEMKANIARECGITIDKINIKATTEEGLGFTGIKEGVSAHAVCMLQKFNMK